ncbi:hypothetical protein WG904_13450 [Pedobacter sp. Du54]|uniref:hypothetical protein n=1 Tax=Pedobacter anseongensis TaxID=3133439 RepID=UPI00309D5104
MRNKDNANQPIKLVTPIVPSQKRIKIYKSLEESKKDDVNYIINQSPIERLRQTVDLILKVYNVTRESLKQRKRSNRITIIKG